MYRETVFDAMIEQLEFMTFQLGFLIFFMLTLLLIAIFKGNGIPNLLVKILAVQHELCRQNEQILKQLESLKMGALSAYEAQYATAKSLQVRADALSEKRGERTEPKDTPPSPVKVRENLQLWIDAKPTKAN